MPSATSPSEIPSHPDIPPFPSPSTFSILPDIYLLIARLNILQGQQPPTSQPTQPQTQSQTQPQLSSSASAIGASQPGQSTPSATIAGGASTQAATSTQPTHLNTTTSPTTTRHIQTSGPPIDAKELPAHVYPIKQKLVKARAAVSALPDLERTVDEQEVEIRQLLQEVALLKARLAKLGGIASTSAASAGPALSGDAAMQGVEG